MRFDRIHDLISRLPSYSVWEVFVELAIIWVVVYIIVRFVQGTRAAGALKGIVVVLILTTVVARVIGGGATFPRLTFLYDAFLALVALALVVIFQPELRRAFMRVGEASFFRSTPTEIAQSIESITAASAYLSKSRFGALIVIERQSKLEALVEGGTAMEALISARLLQTIFFPSTALHDLAVVVRGNIIHSASVQLPLAEPADMPDPRLGSRHRAAVGLTRECDALAVVVSEESGAIRIAEHGELSKPLEGDELRSELEARLKIAPPRRGKDALHIEAEEHEADLLKPAEAEKAAS